MHLYTLQITLFTTIKSSLPFALGVIVRLIFMEFIVQQDPMTALVEVTRSFVVMDPASATIKMDMSAYVNK